MSMGGSIDDHHVAEHLIAMIRRILIVNLGLSGLGCMVSGR